MVVPAIGQAGHEWPKPSAKPRLTAPATSPLTPAINSASEADTLRVRLLSMAQHRQAPMIASVPDSSPTAVPPLGQESATPPATINAMPATMRRSACSLKTTQARLAVSTASRFSSNEAVPAPVEVRPSTSRKGPRTPPKPIATANQSQPEPDRPLGCQPRPRSSRVRARPRPLPR